MIQSLCSKQDILMSKKVDFFLNYLSEKKKENTHNGVINHDR